jgi:hypothetical protein
MTRPPTTSAEAAALLERGYPYLTLLEDGHKDDAKPAASAAKLLDAVDPIYFVRWPRQTTLRFVRGMGVVTEVMQSKLAEAVLANDAPLAKAELASIFEHALTRLSHIYPFQISGLVYGAEALVGADATLEALVSAFEALRAAAGGAPKRFESQHGECDAAVAAGFLLRRASAPLAKEARAKLGSLLEGAPDVPVFNTLTRVLRGAEGVEATGYSWTPSEAWLFYDDPVAVLAALKSTRGALDYDPQALWLAGAPSFALLAKSVKRTVRVQVPYVLESLAMFAGDEARGLEALLAGKGAKPAVAKERGELRATPKPTRTKKPTTKVLEARLDTLMDEVAAALEAVRGDEGAERAVLERAADSYATLRGEWDTDSTAYLTHYYLADGVALTRPRPTLRDRLKPTEAETARWAEALAGSA